MARVKLSNAEISEKIKSLKDWQVNDTNHLFKKFKFGNFAESLKFVNAVGEIAEVQDHHPDITFGWGYAEIFITTHDVGGISESDFVLARKIDDIESTKE